MKTIILCCLVLSVLIASVYSDESCNNGDTKRVDCNTCRCANGLWACTRKACIPRQKRARVCEPGSRYKQDCNTCVCNRDGTNAACTLKACL